MKKRIREALVEAHPLKGADLPPNTAGVNFNAYIPATNSKQAIELLRAKLMDVALELVDVEHCVSLDLEKAQYGKMDVTKGDLKNALSTGEIIFGLMFTWTADS